MRKSYRRIRRERARAKFSAWGKASARVQASARMLREADADTMRWRALHDARGQIIREGVTYTASGETHWQLTRSTCGRVNQVDLLVGGSVRRTGSLRAALRAIRLGFWRAES